MSQPDPRRICAELRAEIRRWRNWTIGVLILLLYGVLLPFYMWLLAPIFGLR